MKTYRSLNTIEAVQYQGAPIPGITCDGHTNEQSRMNAGCDSSRVHLPHVHGNAIGGMIVLKVGDWIFPVQGGPWGVASDGKFRGSWEVPAEAKAPTFPDEVSLAVVPEAASTGNAVAAVADANVGDATAAPEPVTEPVVPVRTTFPNFTE